MSKRKASFSSSQKLLAATESAKRHGHKRSSVTAKRREHAPASVCWAAHPERKCVYRAAGKQLRVKAGIAHSPLQGCAASSLRRLLPGVRLFSNGPGATGMWRGGDTRWGQRAKAPQPRVPLLAGRSVLTAAPRDVYLKTVLSGENRFYFT